MEQMNKYSFIVLCVDAVENDVPKGRYYHSDLSDEYRFHSMDQFLLENDALLNGATPRNPSTPRGSGNILLNGKIATFKLRILYRHNNDWQGSVMLLETRHEVNFRSTLELLSIVHQALIPAQKQRMSPSSLKIAK
ncbi:MAG: hypothetical protein IKM11_07350 [Oscillospiraceae bacterium]|nr:hypothetical protein [Oscillospiraceae bacterium]